jgi:hypothetical protein
MAQPDKELELLRSASDQLTTTISRVSLLRLLVLAVLVFTFANAFKQIDPQALHELEVLEPITKVEAGSFNLDRFQDFFVLNRLFSEQSASTSESASPEQRSFPPLTQAAWDQARPILIRYSNDNKSLIEQESSRITQAIQDNKQEELPREIIDSAKGAQQQLAQQIRKNYKDAFSAELGMVGTKTTIDLRNWLAFLPFIFLFSEAYLLIQRKKLKLLNSVLAKRVEQAEAAAPNSVPTAYRLLLDPERTSDYARHPNQLVEILYLMCSIGLLVYFVVAARSFLAGVSFGQNLLTITIPVSFTLIIAALYTWFYYRAVSIRLEEQLRRQEAIVTNPSRFVLWAGKIKDFFRRPFRQVPRFWLTTGAGLVLITLAMSVSMDSCGGPKRGYELLTNPRMFEPRTTASVSTGTTAAWPTALYSNLRFNKSVRDDDGLRYFIRLNQRLGRTAYLTGLLTAAVSLLLVMLSFVRPRVLHSRAINVLLSLTCGGALLFILADFCFYFVTPRWKLVVLAAYLIGSLLLLLLSVLGNKRTAGVEWSRWKFILKSLWMPVALCAVLLLLIFGVRVDLDIGKAFLTDKQFGFRVGAGLIFELIVENVTFGILTLMIGLKLILLGWRQLYRKEPAT